MEKYFHTRLLHYFVTKYCILYKHVVYLFYLVTSEIGAYMRFLCNIVLLRERLLLNTYQIKYIPLNFPKN